MLLAIIPCLKYLLMVRDSSALNKGKHFWLASVHQVPYTYWLNSRYLSLDTVMRSEWFSVTSLKAVFETWSQSRKASVLHTCQLTRLAKMNLLIRTHDHYCCSHCETPYTVTKIKSKRIIMLDSHLLNIFIVEKWIFLLQQKFELLIKFIILRNVIWAI